MPFNINTFRTNLTGDGARPSLFEVEIYFPPNLGAFPTAMGTYMCKATNLPTSTVGVIDVPYFGRKIKVAGDRTYDDWTCTFINDENMNIRNALEWWSDAMDKNNPLNAKRARGATEDPMSYVGGVIINQYGKMGDVIKTYTLVNAFPNNVGQVDLSWEANDQIEEFDVNWSFDYFNIISTKGTAIGNVII
jgi:hypothetical protein